MKLENGRKYAPKDSDEVKCEDHAFTTTWGKLGAIQRLAIECGIDTAEDLPCILSDKYTTDW